MTQRLAMISILIPGGLHRAAFGIYILEECAPEVSSLSTRAFYNTPVVGFN